MNKEQFTPGPWLTVAGANSKTKTIIAPNAGGEGDPAFICTTSAQGWHSDDLLKISKANASLIEASPAMYEALKKGLAYSKSLQAILNYPDDDLNNDIKKMKAALNKANPTI